MQKLNHDTGWGDCTDPQKHSPDRFRYLVHGINPMAKSAQMYVATLSRASKAIEGGLSVNLLDSPLEIHRRPTISLSLIDQDHRCTWGPAGLIVRAPRSLVIGTSPTDCGSNHALPELVRQQACTLGVRAPADILKESHSYNEVIACGSSSVGEKLEVIGFFVKTADGRAENEILANVVRAKAQRYGLPLVEIEEPRAFSTKNSVQVHAQGIEVIFDQRRFAVYQGEFIACNPTRVPYLPARSEIEAVLNFIDDETNTPPELRSQFEAAYEQAAKRHYEPRIERSEDGTINGVVVLLPSQNGDERISIMASGYTDRTLEQTFREQFSLALASFGPGLYARQPLSTEAASNILDRLIGDSDGKLREELQKFKANAVPEIARCQLREPKDTVMQGSQVLTIGLSELCGPAISDLLRTMLDRAGP